MHILWFLTGLIGAIWVLWDSYKKGLEMKTSLKWAIGVFLLPVAVIPMYILMSKLKFTTNIFSKNNRSIPQDITYSVSIKCNTCKKYFKGNPDCCPHCGAKLKN